MTTLILRIVGSNFGGIQLPKAYHESLQHRLLLELDSVDAVEHGCSSDL